MKETERVKEAKELALRRYYYLLEVREGPNFVEIVGSIGGDVETARYWDNGLVTER